MSATSSRVDIDVALLPKQRALWDSTDRVVGMVAGYGSGKSHAGGAKALQLALANPGREGMIVAPSHRMLVRVALPAFMRYAKPLVAEYNRHDGRISLLNGSTVWLGSVDSPGSCEGSNLAWIWGDEARLWDAGGEAYRILLGRLRDGGASLLQMVLTTTPKAGGWLQREFDSGMTDRATIRSSSRENTFLADGYVDNLLASYSEAQARAYVEGEWVTLEGGVYPEFDRAKHLIDYVVPDGADVIGGVDFGFRWPAAVFAVPYPIGGTLPSGEILPPQSLVVFDEIVDDNMSTEALGARIATMYPAGGRNKLTWLGCDPAGASHSSSASEHGGILDVVALRNGMADAGIRPGIRYVRGSGASVLRSINTGVEKVRGLMRNAKGETRIYFARSMESTRSYRGLVRSIPSYVYKTGTSVPLKGQHADQCDHVMDALRYMIRHYGMVGASVEQYA